MLIEFRVANHRSIREEQTLSMAAANIGDANDPRPRDVGYSEKLLPVAAIYGANASGKSNILSAFAWMRDAVKYSSRMWSPEHGVPRDSFAWGGGRDQPSVFEVMFLKDGIRYQYGFAIDDESILEEWLNSWPRGHETNLFSRKRPDYKFSKSLKGENSLIRDATRPNALFLSTAVQLRHEALLPIYSWFASIRSVNVLPPSQFGVRGSTVFPTPRDSLARMWGILLEGHSSLPFELDEPALVERFRSLIQNADTGLVDVRVARKTADEERGANLPRIQFQHQPDADDSWLPLEQESKGTRTLVDVALPLFHSIDEGAVLLIDELEASLHPLIAQKIVEEFNSPESNPRNAQLIFTTHDTNLLGSLTGEASIRRDEVWLTEKSPNGSTELYPLTDFKPRKDENLERGYLQGRYNAIPFLGNFSLAAESSHVL